MKKREEVTVRIYLAAVCVCARLNVADNGDYLFFF